VQVMTHEAVVREAAACGRCHNAGSKWRAKGTTRVSACRQCQTCCREGAVGSRAQEYAERGRVVDQPPGQMGRERWEVNMSRWPAGRAGRLGADRETEGGGCAR